MLMMKRLHIEQFYLNRQDEEYPMTVRVIATDIRCASLPSPTIVTNK